jgi:hypothetical protein
MKPVDSICRERKKKREKLVKKQKRPRQKRQDPQQCLSPQYSKSQRADQTNGTMTRKGVEQRGKKEGKLLLKAGKLLFCWACTAETKERKEKKQSRPAGD